MAPTDIVHKLDGLSRSPDRSWHHEYPETQAGQVEKITQMHSRSRLWRMGCTG